MMQISKNSQLVYDIGGAHSLVEAYIASPTSSPYVGIKTTQLYSTQNHCSAFLCRSVPAATINYSILVKVQSAIKAQGRSHLLGLAYDHKTWAYPTKSSLGHCGLSAASTHKLAFCQAGITHYSQLHNTTALY